MRILISIIMAIQEQFCRKRRATLCRVGGNTAERRWRGVRSSSACRNGAEYLLFKNVSRGFSKRNWNVKETKTAPRTLACHSEKEPPGAGCARANCQAGVHLVSCFVTHPLEPQSLVALLKLRAERHRTRAPAPDPISGLARAPRREPGETRGNIE